MLEIALHAGTEHPSLAWVIVSAIGSLIAGFLLGHYAHVLRSRGTESATPTNE